MTGDLKPCQHPQVMISSDDGVWRCQSLNCDAEWQTLGEWRAQVIQAAECKFAAQRENDDHRRIVDLTEKVAARDALLKQMAEALRGAKHAILVLPRALTKDEQQALLKGYDALDAYDRMAGKQA